MKRVASCFLAFLILISTVFSVSAARFTPPFYGYTIGDRIDKNMPTPFSVASVPSDILAQMDFGGVQENVTMMSWSMGDWNTTDGTLQIEKNDSQTLAQKLYRYTGPVEVGAYYAFVCKIKEENYSGTVKPRTILSAYQQNTWKGESGNRVQIGATDANGFYELTQVIKVPEGTDELRLTAQMDVGTQGKVSYDDFKLYKIYLDPLKTVLLKPAYKGFLYGDGTADIALDILIAENPDVYLLQNMELSVRLLDEEDNVLFASETPSPKAFMNVTFSSKGLSEGTYYLNARLIDKATGGVLSEKEHTLRKVDASYRPVFYVDENGHAVRNGKKTFFKKIYNAQNDYAKIANDIKNTEVDIIGHNGMGWWFSDPNENMTEAFSILKETGKRIHLSLMGYWWGNRELDVNMFKSMVKNQRGIRQFFTQIVAEHKDNEILDGYYLFDEPNPILYGEEIRWNQEIISSLDADRPTYGITDSNFANYGIFTKMVDVLGIDPYPISGKDTDDIASIGRSVREISESFPNRPVYLCLQGFNYTGQYGEESRGPNYEELRNMAYQAICEGVDGLDCYAYQAMMNDPSGKTFEEWWNELTTLYADVEKYEDIILSDEPAPAFTVNGGGEWLNITTRRYNGKSYLFAVNNTKQTQNATVAMENIRSAVTDTGEALPFDSSGISLAFAPLEVKIVEIAQQEYLSGEAELISLGFFNCKKAFPVVKSDENALQITDDSVIINYHAQISDGAKLYINGTEKPLTGKISIRHADNFTVRVVAADGKTETNIRYVIDRQQ